MWLLCAWSDLISSLYRQGKAIERRNTRGIIVGISIAKSYPPPKAANTQQPKAANTIPKATCLSHISTPTPQKPPERSPQWNLPAPIRMDLTPQNISDRLKMPHSQPLPFQPPSLSPPPFHHLRQKYLPCFHGYCQELFTIKDLSLQIPRSLKSHQEPRRWVWISSAFQNKARKGTSGRH